MWASLWGEEIPHVGDLHAAILDSSVHLLYFSFADLSIRDPCVEASGSAGGFGRACRESGGAVGASALQLCVSVSITEVLAEPAEDGSDCLCFVGGAVGAHFGELVVCFWA